CCTRRSRPAHTLAPSAGSTRRRRPVGGPAHPPWASVTPQPRLPTSQCALLERVPLQRRSPRGGVLLLADTAPLEPRDERVPVEGRRLRTDAVAPVGDQEVPQRDPAGSGQDAVRGEELVHHRCGIDQGGCGGRWSYLFTPDQLLGSGRPL